MQDGDVLATGVSHFQIKLGLCSQWRPKQTIYGLRAQFHILLLFG